MNAASGLALRPQRGPFTLEKWYLDTVTPDGTVLLVYLVRVRIFGVPVARVTADLFVPGEPQRRGDAGASPIVGHHDRLRFGPAELTTDSLTWNTAGLSGRLRFTPRHPGETPLDPFVAVGERRLEWTVEVPDAEVEGEVSWPRSGQGEAASLAIAGRGYRDRVWFDLLPWRFPLTELLWGRFAGGEHAATWVKATTADGVIEGGWCDGRITAGRPPGLETISSRPFLEGSVLDLEGLRLLAPLRGLLKRVGGDPHQSKAFSRARLGGTEGVAIEEVVRWR